MHGCIFVDFLAEKDLLDLVSNDDILKVAEYFRLKEQGKNAPDRFEFLGRKKDNTHFYTELSISAFKANNKNYIVMVTRDITERKRAQKAIRESEEKTMASLSFAQSSQVDLK